jgi:hypothetical protein
MTDAPTPPHAEIKVTDADRAYDWRRAWQHCNGEIDALIQAFAAHAEAARIEEREACALVADENARTFLSPEYATNQPLSSFQERFACKQIAIGIRARGEV